jgi:hypothetical protein
VIVGLAVSLRASSQPLGAPGGTPPPTQTAPDGPTGLLRVEMDASDTRVIVDGVDMGAAALPGQPPRALALPAGVHRVALTRPGHAPVAFEVEIAPGQTSVVRWRPPAEPREPEDGYQVIPPRASSPDRSPEGSGYFVVPKP